MAEKKTTKKTKKAAAKKMGRPTIKIDKDQFERLCGIQCTLIEIAGIFDCSEDTIERWCKKTYNLTFADAFKKHSASGKISLRRMQFRMAEKSAAMAIFLGKQYLGQKDIIEEVNNEDVTDDGFLKAIKGSAKECWSEYGKD